MSVRLRCFLLAIVVWSIAAPVSATAPSDHPAEVPNATLVEAYPNPVAEGDSGEFLTVRFDGETNGSGWVLTDGNTVARLPDRTFDGTVAVSSDPESARRHTDHAVVALAGRLSLANGGDRIELRRDDRTVDTVRYRNAPESRIRAFEAGTWRPVGATDFEPTRVDGGEATALVLPDADERTVETLRDADRRLLLAGYTLTSERVTEALLAADRRGTEVRVLLDGAPVGGVTDRQARLLERLAAAGIEVRLLAGPHARYRHHHPKYAVVDEQALVSTENFKPAGTGGMSSRGWAIVLHDAEVADALAELHATDRRWRAATPWREYRKGRDFADEDPALGEFESRRDPRRVEYEAARLLAAPDNAEAELVEELDAADERILLQQVEIDDRENRLLRAVLRAADRGVTVRIHLSDGWYVEEDNAALVAWLNRRADAEGWDLKARVDGRAGGHPNYEKVHTKGVIVDDTVVLGSLNWANEAGQKNREVLVALSGTEVVDYYAAVFDADWSGTDTRPLSVGLLGGVAVAVSAALLVGRRIRFLGRDSVVTDWRW